MFWGFLMTCIVCSGEDDSPDVGFPGGPEDPPDIELPDTGDDGAPAFLVVDPGSLDFGELPCDEESWLTLVLRNEGGEPLYLHDVFLEQQTEVFELGPVGTTLLEAGEETEMDVGFNAGLIGDATASVWIASSDIEVPELEVPLSATALAPILDINPYEFDFGTVAIGCEVSQLITLSNVGNSTLELTNLDLNTGSSELVLDLLTDTNGALSWSIEPGESVEALVTYTPSDGYQDVSYLLVDSSDPKSPTAMATQSGVGSDEGQSPDCGN